MSVLLATPEALLNARWREVIKTWASRIVLLAIDEAHCLTEWYVMFHYLLLDQVHKSALLPIKSKVFVLNGIFSYT